MGDPDTPLLTWGYHHYFHGLIRRPDLDAISVTLRSSSGTVRRMNSCSTHPRSNSRDHGRVRRWPDGHRP